MEIASNGRYRFELRRYPREFPQAIEATRAVVEIGEERANAVIKRDATQAIVEVTLKKGEYDIKTVLYDPTVKKGMGGVLCLCGVFRQITSFKC